MFLSELKHTKIQRKKRMQPTGIKLCKVPRILIVEDDISQRQLMVKLSRAAFDCEILEASDGLEALMIMLLDNQVPDLVILDLILPCMNGVEFLKIVRGRPEFNHIPVVVCSSVEIGRASCRERV